MATKPEKFEFKKYVESDEVKNARDKASEYEANNNPGEWKGGTYGDAVKEAWNNINNRAKFSYDLNGDALYQQYKDKYINQGRLAMADTIGQASAMTGGYGSSYAVTAGNQAYQSHLQNLNDIVPQLYQMAYDRYNQEGQDLKDKYSILNNMYQTEYGEHRDKVSDYNTTLDRYINAYNNLSSTEYARHNTEQNNAFNEYNQILNEAQMAASIGDTSKLNELGYDTSNMSTGGGGGGGNEPSPLFGGLSESEFIDKMASADEKGAKALVIAAGESDAAWAIYDLYFGNKDKGKPITPPVAYKNGLQTIMKN